MITSQCGFPLDERIFNCSISEKCQCCDDQYGDQWKYPEPYNQHLLSIWNYLGSVGMEFGLSSMRDFLNL